MSLEHCFGLKRQSTELSSRKPDKQLVINRTGYLNNQSFWLYLLTCEYFL